MKSLALILLTVLALCTGVVYSQEANKDTFVNELSLTLDLISKSETVNGLWRDTRKLVEQAQEAASKENYGDALALLKQAQFQAKAGYRQATSQDNLDQLVPYYLK